LDDSSNKVTMKDANDNILEMSSGGIKLESSQTITIKAANLNLEALQTVNIKGNASTMINSPSGGPIKLGFGVRPAAAVGDPVTPPVPGPQIVMPPGTSGGKVLI